MAFDPATGTSVLFGGAASFYLNDTWTGNGALWSQATSVTVPQVRYGSSEVYDTATGQFLLFGGSDFTNFYNDTYTWNGSSWTLLSPAHSPAPRSNAGMVYDAALHEVILCGGRGIGLNNTYNDTWAWNGTDWTQLSPLTSPTPLLAAAVTYDAATGDIVVFGGNDNNATLAQTWIFSGGNWSEVFPSSSPSAREDVTSQYDPATGNVVLFGGSYANHPLSDTWTWNGTTWSQLSPSTVPAARHGEGMEYDPVRGAVIMFGGAGVSSDLNDTWTWTGSNWQQLVAPPGPPAPDPATGRRSIRPGGRDRAGNGNGATGSSCLASAPPPHSGGVGAIIPPGPDQPLALSCACVRRPKSST